MLVVGIFVLIVGISDFGIAAVHARGHAASSSGVGAGQPPVSRMLRRTGVITVAIGLVLILVGLVT
jgi:hypothetical protein